MTSNPRRHSVRDPRSGRWARVPVELAYEADSKFGPTRSIDVNYPDDQADFAYRLVGRDENNADPRYAAPRVADDLAVGGSPLRARRPEMVSETEDEARTYYGNVQGEVGRAAARAGHRGLDPTLALIDPYGSHGSRLTGVEVNDGRA